MHITTLKNQYKMVLAAASIAHDNTSELHNLTEEKKKQ